MATQATSHVAEQQHPQRELGHDDMTANASNSPSLLRSAPLLVDYLTQVRLASFSGDASQIVKGNRVSKLKSDTLFDAIGQLVIKTNGAFGVATEKVREIEFRLHTDKQLVPGRQGYDYFSIDEDDPHLELEAMQNFMRDLVTSAVEIKEEFAVVREIAKDIKCSMVNDAAWQDDTSADKPEAVGWKASQKTIVHDFQTEARNALKSLQKVNQQLDEESEQLAFEDVSIKALTGLETELWSIMDYFQTLSVQTYGMCGEIAQKITDYRQHEAPGSRPTADTRELMMESARYVGTTEVRISLFEDLTKNFLIPPMQRIETLARESTSEQRQEFKKYYRNAMKGCIQATESLAEKSSNDILALPKAGISVIDTRQRTHEVPLGDQKKTKEDTGAGAQEEGDDAAHESYGDGPILGISTEVFETDEGDESEAARNWGQRAARDTMFFDNELRMTRLPWDHKEFK